MFSRATKESEAQQFTQTLRQGAKLCPLAMHFLLEVKKIVVTGVLPEKGGWTDQPDGLEATFDWCLAQGYIDSMRSGF